MTLIPGTREPLNAPSSSASADSSGNSPLNVVLLTLSYIEGGAKEKLGKVKTVQRRK